MIPACSSRNRPADRDAAGGAEPQWVAQNDNGVAPIDSVHHPLPAGVTDQNSVPCASLTISVGVRRSFTLSSDRAVAGKHFYDGFIRADHSDEAKGVIDGVIRRLNDGEEVDASELDQALSPYAP